MPTTFVDAPVVPLPSTLLPSDIPILPIHLAQYRQSIERRRRSVNLTDGTELSKFRQTSPASAESDCEEDLSPEDTKDDPSFVAEASQSQMRRSGHRKKGQNSPSPRPGLRIKTSREDGLNGHANGKMGSHIEMRRKHGADDPDIVRAQVMSRSDFSLDNEPIPPTPATPGMISTAFSDLPLNDKRNFLLLVLLYFLQGIPMGLASGSVPFLLKKYLSYSQIGIFSLAIYPYSLKLLWSPIVDAVWSRRFGRRKSWIIPIQALSGLSMVYLGSTIDKMMIAAGKDAGSGVWNFTGWWFMLVFLCATQDIAVDGWAISLLSIQNISYASTAQTVGLTAGAFLSHTVFLAFNAPDFANKWFRAVPKDYGLVSLGGYMVCWGWVYLIVTTALAVFKREEKTKERDGIAEVYRSMWAVLKLKPILTIIVIHLIAKLGFVTNEAVTNLKLLDKGFGQANLALVVLIDFPFEIGLGYYAGKWSTDYTPLRLWCWAFVARLVAALFAQFTVMIYPVAEGMPLPTWYMLIVIFSHICSTFLSTVMFVAVSAFHARIADPTIGGTYMTLLATVSNLGGTFPKIFVLKAVDYFTQASCIPPSDTSKLIDAGIAPITATFSCATEVAKERCLKGGGTCMIERDGFYLTNVIFVIIGAVTFYAYIQRKALGLQALPVRAWRIGTSQSYTRLPTS